MLQALMYIGCNSNMWNCNCNFSSASLVITCCSEEENLNNINSHLKGFTYAECHMKAFHVYFTLEVENDSMIFKIVV